MKIIRSLEVVVLACIILLVMAFIRITEAKSLPRTSVTDLSVRRVHLGVPKAEVIRILGVPARVKVHGDHREWEHLDFNDQHSQSEFMQVGLERGVVIALTGFVLEVRGVEIATRGKRPAHSLFDVLGPSDAFYDGKVLTGTPMPLRWDNLHLYIYEITPQTTAQPQWVPFIVGTIQLVAPQ